MSNSMVNTTVSGGNVTIVAKIDPSDAARGSWIRLTSKYDYGYGKGMGVGDYPYIVSIIELGSNTSYTSTQTYRPGLYVAELNIMGIGPVDFSTFELTTPALTGSISTSVSGNNVAISVKMGAGSRYDWWIRIVSKYDYGYGKGQGVGTYPWIVEIINGTTQIANYTKTYKPGLYAAELNIMGVGPVDYELFELVAPALPPSPGVFSFCYGKTVPTNCGMNPQLSTVNAGDVISIKADIVNYSSPGMVNAIFKIDNVAVFNDTIQNLVTATGGAGTIYWSPVLSGYTMPNKTISIVIETYGWDTSKSAWVAGGTQNITITPSVPSCTGIDLVPFSAKVNTGEKVDLIVVIAPGNVAFPVTFKDRTGAALGTCKTSGTGLATGGSTCVFTWDSSVNGKTAGTYYVKAYSGNCTSTETVIEVNQPIRQWNFGITVIDSVTGLSVQSATVLVATAGKASQSKLTDATGFVTFRLDEGTISVAINKDKYNAFNTAEYLFTDIMKTYQFAPIPPSPTVGEVQFVSVPSASEIFIDGKTTGQKTPLTVTNIPGGSHSWALKLAGYNDSQGNVIVPSGGATSVYVTMTPVTPTMGSLNITSHPVMDAEVWIDGKDTGLATSGLTIITDIPPGNHSYKVALSGYKDSVGKFGVVAGQTITLDVEMIPIATIGTLEMTSEPSGARIYLDDKDTQRVTPATIVNLNEGDHKYRSVLSGYKEISGIVSIIPGGTKVVHILLEKEETGIGTIAIVAIAGVAVLSFMKSGESK